MEDRERVGWACLFRPGRRDIAALHKTWFAYFLTFFVWFNLAPLATTIIKSTGLTEPHLKMLAVCNVALAAPGRYAVGLLTDRYGPRDTFTAIMVLMSLPCFAFAFSEGYTQMLVSRLLLSLVGTGFVVGIYMTSLWFKPRDLGFVQGVEAGLGNWGASIAAVLMPVLALSVFGSWRYAAALSGLVMLIYGLYYRHAITDGPSAGTRRPAGPAVIRVCSWGDLVSAMLWTVPITGVLAVVVWRMNGMGYIGEVAAAASYAVIGAVVLVHVAWIARHNYPLLKQGVDESDRYRFADVGALCLCFAVTFGAELAVISLLPQFFEKTFGLGPVLAGLMAAVFAFMNFFSRSFGGQISERSLSRRGAILVYLALTGVSFFVMGLIDSSWPVWLAAAATAVCALFVTGACGVTFAIVPLINRRVTGQITGYVGSFGNVGAVLYLVAYTFLDDSRFFLMLGGAALFTFLFCFFFLREPSGAFSQEYQISSGDKMKGRPLARKS